MARVLCGSGTGEGSELRAALRAKRLEAKRAKSRANNTLVMGFEYTALNA